MVNIFHCYEFLLLRKLDSDPEFWNKIKESVLKENCYFCKTVSPELWFVAVTISETKERFPSFIRKTVLKDPYYAPSHSDCILTRYLHHHDFVEMHLDSIFKHSDDCFLPKELFKCPNLKVLSLKYNSLEKLPPDIGKLQKLEYLAISNNKLQNTSIPFSLSFCTSLKVLHLDNNLLDALPGFLLRMPNLSSVHRHGNHNYFKATFMWYHTDVNERILAIGGYSPCLQLGMQSLKLLAATAIIASKINFFNGSMPPFLVDYICSIYFDFNVCYKCCYAARKSSSGFKVYTFKNPYLGNTCVPFQHWACSLKCAEAIEVPAREEQLLAAHEQDLEYRQLVQQAHDSTNFQNKNMIKFTCSIM